MKRIVKRVAFWLWYLTPVLRGWSLERHFWAYKKRIVKQQRSRCRHLREAHWEREGKLDKAYAAKVAVVRDKHAKELAEVRAHASAVIERCSSIQFRRQQHDRFSILLQFSPRLMAFGGTYQEELRFIAQDVAYRVEREIATAKFIHSAREQERLDYEQRMVSQYGFHSP